MCVVSKAFSWHGICYIKGVIRKWVILIAMMVSVLPIAARKRKPIVPDSLQRLAISVNGIEFTMQRVEGGSFVMGATPDQYDRDIYTDKPAHLVFLSPYYIAAAEVPVLLWRAVMPEMEVINPKGYPTVPVSYVSWYDCQEFVRRLDSITGLPFRLPTEAEWEYQKRNGNMLLVVETRVCLIVLQVAMKRIVWGGHIHVRVHGNIR